MDNSILSPSQRFLIAILVQSDLKQKLRAAYQDAFNTPCKVKTLHLTLIPPFTIQGSNIKVQKYLSKLPTFTQTFSFGSPQLFVQHKRKILYLPILPTQPIKAIYDEISNQYQTSFDIDVTSFSNKKVPEFVPHVTLAYNFKEDHTKLIPPHEPFFLPQPQLLIEKGPGIWLPI